MKKSPVKILSVGGSIIIPPTGFDTAFLSAFRELILGEVEKGQRFILTIGGGSTCRNYQQAAKNIVSMTDTDLDWLGIKVTILNAEFVKQLFAGYVHDIVVTNPTKKVTTKKPIIVAAGWKPGCSTDNDAVLLAKTYGAKEVINLSNIDYVYDSDPKQNPNAKKIERADWKTLRSVVGDTWTPGANVPFDPKAAKTAEKLKLMVRFVRGTDLLEVASAITGETGKGTIIS